MTQEEIAQPSMYCRQCGYALVGLSEDRCPECARPFNPADSRTFLRHPRSYQRRRWIKRIALTLATVALLGAIFVAACFGWVYWQYHADWQAEQQAIAALAAVGGRMSAKTTATELSDPGPLYRLRSRLDYLRLRVQVIRLDGPPRSEVDLVHLSAFKRCEAIHLTNLGIADDQLRHLAGLTQLASLDLAGNPGVTDRGLVHLKALTALMYLHLDKTAVTDAGLEHLEQLPNLQMLSVQGTKVTPEGIRQLKQTTPSLTIEGP